MKQIQKRSPTSDRNQMKFERSLSISVSQALNHPNLSGSLTIIGKSRLDFFRLYIRMVSSKGEFGWLKNNTAN